MVCVPFLQVLHKMVRVDDFEQDEVADADPVLAHHGAAADDPFCTAPQQRVVQSLPFGAEQMENGSQVATAPQRTCFFAAPRGATHIFIIIYGRDVRRAAAVAF